MNNLSALVLGYLSGTSFALLFYYLFREKPKIIFDYLNMRTDSTNNEVCYVVKKNEVECPKELEEESKTD